MKNKIAIVGETGLGLGFAAYMPVSHPLIIVSRHKENEKSNAEKHRDKYNAYMKNKNYFRVANYKPTHGIDLFIYQSMEYETFLITVRQINNKCCKKPATFRDAVKVAYSTIYGHDISHLETDLI